MHELKTPITKGKLLVELEKNIENDQKQREVFYRLEGLIGEFASVEEFIAKKEHIVQNEYLFADIVDNAEDLLFDEDHTIIKEFSDDLKINVNFKLFSIAVKNLLDNAIKYSSDNEVTILEKNQAIVFINGGEPLKYELEKYFEPFFKEEQKDDQKQDGSFGLGLYIVHSILSANDFGLEYQYEDGKNHFIIYQ
jgi:two-component system OmpR family sensor kinase